MSFGNFTKWIKGSACNKEQKYPHKRVHNRFGGMRDLAIFRGDIRDMS